MIIDVVMFRDELDLLDCRLHELKGRVDHHVLTEAAYTHRGVPKPLIYQENRSRYAAWENRLTHIVVEKFPDPDPAHSPREAAWAREHYQRDSALPFLEDFCAPDDIILIADLDEFPSDEALAWNGVEAVSLLQRTFHSAVDFEYPQPQYTSVMARFNMVSARGLASVRDGRYSYPVLRNGGFHFSWLGTTQDRRNKLEQATCHLEMPEREWSAIGDGTTYERGEHFASDSRVIPVDVDDTFPEWIRERKCPSSWFRPR